MYVYVCARVCVHMSLHYGYISVGAYVSSVYMLSLEEATECSFSMLPLFP